MIDGGHRLSALRAWMLDDYGDGAASLAFYKGEISTRQKEIAKHTRKLVEKQVGRYSTLLSQVDTKNAPEQVMRRAQVLFTRALPLQWIQGDASVAETSFFKINSQGTPLDDTEALLIVSVRLLPSVLPPKPARSSPEHGCAGGGGGQFSDNEGRAWQAAAAKHR